MKKNKKIFVAIAVIIIIGLAAWGGMFLYEAAFYYTTDNASVSADTVAITPLITGNVLVWNVSEGDDVDSGQVLGRQNLENLVQSTAVNATTLGQSAGSNVSKADIKTPISGKVVQSSVVVGEVVSPGMQVAVVADVNNLYITANIEENDINKIQVGQAAKIKIDAYPKVEFTGFVQSIGEATQSAFSSMPSINTSGTFTKVTQLVPVKINISGIEDYKLRLGYNATVKIRTK